MDGTRFRATHKKTSQNGATQDTPSGLAGPPRLGPRPFPLHLASAATTWMSCGGVLPFLKSGWQTWKPERHPDLAARAQALKADIDAFEAQQKDGQEAACLQTAIEKEGRLRLDGFLRGVEAYRHHPYRRCLETPPTAWQAGRTQLLDFAFTDEAPDKAEYGTPLLVVPSLINRSYILDLAQNNSLMRFLARQGFRPFLLDWGSPGGEERDFTLTDYIAGRLEGALDAVLALCGRPPVLMGYCMGGNLALALAGRRHRDLQAMVLLATPWNFHTVGQPIIRATTNFFLSVQPIVEHLGVMPVEALQTMFSAVHPGQTIAKFRAFADLPQDSEKAKAFVALEDWVHDGVPLAASVARECILDWYRKNSPQKGQWRIAGDPVRPQNLRQAVGASGAALPILAALPTLDRIVPPASAAALLSEIPWADTLPLRAGHIGMIASRKAPDMLWSPLVTWLKNTVAASYG